jgi:hypothetical protein
VTSPPSHPREPQPSLLASTYAHKVNRPLPTSVDQELQAVFLDVFSSLIDGQHVMTFDRLVSLCRNNDVNGTGTIRIETLHGIFRQLGVFLTPDTYAKIGIRFGVTRTSQVDSIDYDALCQVVRDSVWRHPSQMAHKDNRISPYHHLHEPPQDKKNNALAWQAPPPSSSSSIVHAAPSADTAFIPMPFTPSTVETWLQHGASATEKKQFQQVYASIFEFQNKAAAAVAPHDPVCCILKCPSTIRHVI